MSKINFDTPPDAIDPNWRIKPEHQIESRVRGEWHFRFDKIGLHITRLQKQGGIATGWEVLEQLKGKPVMGVKLLEYIVASWKDFRIVFPKKWDGLTMFFWGTIYDQDWREQDGQLYVEFLYFNFENKECIRGYRFMNNRCFDSNCPAVISVTPSVVNMDEKEAESKIAEIADDIDDVYDLDSL